MDGLWDPPNLAEPCAAVQTNFTNCATSTLLFLQLISSLYGFSKDSAPKLYGKIGGGADKKKTSSNSNGTREKFDEHYDFIVVGAGSAGCVVANRLTEIKAWRVLLLEAGEEEPEVADVPSFAPALQRSSIDWNYLTQPSTRSCLARQNRQCYWARGKVMGGSSTINFMIYVRGGAEDYNEWASMGNPGWSYEEVLPYFIRSENNNNPELVEPGYHGVGGYQNVEIHRYQDRNIFPLIDSFRELGLPENDPNGRNLLGVSIMQATVRDGQRESTNGAFIRPIRWKRKNIFIKTKARVTKILIEPKTKNAYGVEYVLKNKVHRAYARKEVILSAGSINSPQILMVSGVGPKSHLESMGIPVLNDLPVGQNLHDHTTIDGVVFALSNLTSTVVDDRRRANEVYFYQQTHRGPHAATGSIQVNAMVQTRYETSGNRPDIQYSFDGINVQDFYEDPVLAARTRVLPLAYYNGLMVRPILLNPKSRGEILLNSTDPVFGAPLIFPNTFAEETDLLRIVDGIKISLSLLQTFSLQQIGVRLVATPLPACVSFQFGSDDYWRCVVQSYTTTIFHPVGTCKMGPKDDPTTVVNPRLQVYGVTNLRVIDASIMPKVIRGNTNAPAIMIGEKGSDFIKERWLSVAENIIT